jgi:hypothetical protein
MNSKSDRESLPHVTGNRTPKKRFRIVKLEERIAPAKGGNGTNNCGGGNNSDSSASSGFSGGGSIY